MAVIPLLRTIKFMLIFVVSSVVLGICAYLQYLISKYTNLFLPFAPLAIGVACLTAVSLPLLLVLDRFRRHAFASTILFELIWFTVLWVLWAGTAATMAATRSYYFPAGCVYFNDAPANRFCYEFTIVQALAFFNLFTTFVYFNVLLFYAIISTHRGQSVWTLSVKDATSDLSSVIGQGVSMLGGQRNPMSVAQHQDFGLYSPNTPSSQPYNGYPQPPLQSYNAYPQQVSYKPSSQRFDTTVQQAYPTHFSLVSRSQTKQSSSRPSSSGGPQEQVQYSSYPSGINPQDLSYTQLPSYSSHLTGDHDSQQTNGYHGPLTVPQRQH